MGSPYAGERWWRKAATESARRVNLPMGRWQIERRFYRSTARAIRTLARRSGWDFAAGMAAERLTEHLRRSGYIVMRARPGRPHSAG